MIRSRALFLDRDGVVNIDKKYVHTKENCDFVDGIFDLVKKANQFGYKVFIVTNQAGIARSYYTEEQFLSFSEWMKSEFVSYGAYVDAIYYCPHHPEHGHGIYHIDCNCRKPKPGMLLKAQADFDIDMGESIMIGDNLTDIEAANSAKIGQRYLFTLDDIDNYKAKSAQVSDSATTFIAITSLSQVDLSPVRLSQK